MSVAFPVSPSRVALPSWLLLSGCTLLIGIVFLTDEHRWDRSGLKDYVESAEERASAAQSGNNLRRLAFLTIGQLAYIILGVSLLAPKGVTGSQMHIAMHAFGKITLFFCAGAILVAAHKSNISDMRGLGKQMPLTMIAFFIGSLSIIGVPPTGGTWSKWYLLAGTLDTQHKAVMHNAISDGSGASFIAGSSETVPLPGKNARIGMDRR